MTLLPRLCHCFVSTIMLADNTCFYCVPLFGSAYHQAISNQNEQFHLTWLFSRYMRIGVFSEFLIFFVQKKQNDRCRKNNPFGLFCITDLFENNRIQFHKTKKLFILQHHLRWSYWKSLLNSTFCSISNKYKFKRHPTCAVYVCLCM